MKKHDARRLDHKTLTELRKRAVESIRKGESPEKVAEVLNVNRVTVYGWLARFREGGMGALNASKRGGRPRKLDGRALKWIFDTVSTKNPLQMKFSFALWTSKMVGELIARKYKIRLSKASVCRLLNQLGLTPQKPVWKAYQQKPEEVKRWLKKEYPTIQALAKKMKADIYFSDEAGVRSDFHSGTTWAIKGETPQVQSTGARFGLNMISAVNAQGKFRFMVVKGGVGAKVFIEFLKRIIYGSKRMVFLIVDGHPAHKAIIVKRFLEREKKKISCSFFLLTPQSSILMKQYGMT
jgi:transposase